jgi:hypothetical protein
MKCELPWRFLITLKEIGITLTVCNNTQGNVELPLRLELALKEMWNYLSGLVSTQEYAFPWRFIQPQVMIYPGRFNLAP